MFTSRQRQIITSKLSEVEPFACFRMPGSDVFRFDGEDDVKILINDFNQPVSQAKTVADYHADTHVDSDKYSTQTPQTSYLHSVRDIISHLQNIPDTEHKVVLSRTLCGNIDPSAIIDTAVEYFGQNPHAFCLLMLTCDGKVIIMASPELLIDVEPETIRTMALAGTRNSENPVPTWDEKNIREQHIVADFILNELLSLGYSEILQNRLTLRSNNVEHICATFQVRRMSAAESLLNDETIAFINALSPTPAVCGYPRADALRQIALHEKRPRRFYAGYTLVCDTWHNRITAFVNLRFVQIDLSTGQYTIQVGSGITALSDPHEEWHETSLKAKPLVDILNHYELKSANINEQ